MSGQRPPDGFDDVLRQVEDALDQLDLGPGATRDALLSGVRAALEELGPDALDQLGVDLEATLEPSARKVESPVRVVDGGLGPDSAPSAGARPDLRVASPGERGPGAHGGAGVQGLTDVSASDASGWEGQAGKDPGPKGLGSDEDAGDDATDEATNIPLVEGSTRVRVVRVSRSDGGTASRGADPEEGAGRIGLPAGAWQTVYRGTTPARYRIQCDLGTLQVALDGTSVEMLVPGQTADFEGLLLRVASTEGPTKGRYWAVAGRHR
jgi:hypothetical protein